MLKVNIWSSQSENNQVADEEKVLLSVVVQLFPISRHQGRHRG